MSQLFGWSYPPGVSHLPWDEERQCAICFLSTSQCMCPECPVCGVVGEPECYDTEGHGLEETAAQQVAIALWEGACRETENFSAMERAEMAEEYQKWEQEMASLDEEYYRAMDQWLEETYAKEQQ